MQVTQTDDVMCVQPYMKLTRHIIGTAQYEHHGTHQFRYQVRSRQQYYKRGEDVKPLAEARKACCVACAFVQMACAFLCYSCVLRGHGAGQSSHTSTIIQGVDFM